MPKIISQSTIDNILLLKEKGFSVNKIQKELKIAKSTVSKVLKSFNLSYKQNKYIFSEDQVNKILYLYNSNTPISKISKIFNISSDPIKRILRQFNVEIKPKEFYKTKHKIINFDYFESINDQEKAYFLGLIYADGCNETSINRVSISLEECDKYILKKLSEKILEDGHLFFIKKRKQHHKDQYRFYVINEKISKDLEKYGVLKNKTEKLTFPKNISEKYYRFFIKGFFDGDGCITKTRNRDYTISFSSTLAMNKYLKKFFKSKLGIHCSTYIKKNKKYCDIFINGNLNVYCFCKWLYKNSIIHLSRKYNRFLNLENYLKNLYGEDFDKIINKKLKFLNNEKKLL